MAGIPHRRRDVHFFASLYFMFDSNTWQMQFVENIPWVSEFGISYHMGIDGISLLLVLLTTFLSALAILSTWSAVTERVKGYMVSLCFSKPECSVYSVPWISSSFTCSGK